MNDNTEETAQDIADEHEHIIEFGRAVKQLEEAANILRRNGHWVESAYSKIEAAQENLDIVGQEEMLLDEYRREFIQEQIEQGATREEAREAWAER